MKVLLALLLAAPTTLARDPVTSGLVTGSCLAAFNRGGNFRSWRYYAASVEDDGACHAWNSDGIAWDSSNSVVPIAGSGHFWAKSRCRLQVYHGSNCRGRWLNVDARIISTSWTWALSEIGPRGSLVPVGFRPRFASARCSCGFGAAAMAQQPEVGRAAVAMARSGSSGEEEDDEEEDDEDEEEEEEEEGEAEALDDRRRVARRRYGAVAGRGHRACSYHITHGSTHGSRRHRRRRYSPLWGSVKRNRCVTRLSYEDTAVAFRGFAMADNGCQFEAYRGKRCSSERLLLAPGPYTFGDEGSARLVRDFEGWEDIKSFRCRCW